jgi:hypothetical protein
MKVKQTKEDWQERMGTIRQLQNEEGNATATITSWNLTDNQKFVEFEYRIDLLEEVHTERFKAPEPADNNTILEIFLDELGYNISTMHHIETEQPTFEVSPTEDGDWSIKDMIGTKGNKEQSQEYEPPGWATSEEDKFKYEMIVHGILFGIVLFPIIVGLLYRDKLDNGFTHESIALSIISSFIHTVLVSITIGLLFVML